MQNKLMQKNEYLYIRRDDTVINVDVDEDRADDNELSYYKVIFRILERDYGLSGFIIYFAWGSRSPLPRTGPNVIALIFGDEHCRVPAYATAVAAVFKCHGFFPNYVPRLQPLRLAQIEAVAFLRDLSLWLPTGWRWVLSPRVRAHCHLVPLPYGRVTDIQAMPFDERPHLISFMGSVAPPASGKLLRRLIGTPKYYCRSALVQVLKQLQQHFGENKIRLNLTTGFADSMQKADSYLDILSRTKICVAPRGTAHETLRLMEGFRFGCVVIADRLPSHPIYRNSPIIQITDWRNLPALLDKLLKDPNTLPELARQSAKYWDDVLSERTQAANFAVPLRVRSALFT